MIRHTPASCGLLGVRAANILLCVLLCVASTQMSTARAQQDGVHAVLDGSAGPHAPARHLLQATACTSKYTVKAGDTLGRIATTYKTTVAAIQKVNPFITNPDIIAVGLVITLPNQPCPSPPPGTNTCTIKYTVKAGDTLTKIATAHKTTVAAILQANPSITNPDLIQLGQLLFIPKQPCGSPPKPSPHPESPPPGCKSTYTIKSGDTCWKVWVAYSMTEEQFRAANRGIDCLRLRVGQKVCTVKPKVTIKCALYYKVKAGDTCWSIATASGLSVQQVQALNPTVQCKALQIGSNVCVRDGGNKITPAPADMVYCVKAAVSRAAETCRAFAARNKITLALLQSLNPDARCTKALPSGSQLCIQGKKVAHVADYSSPTSPARIGVLKVMVAAFKGADKTLAPLLSQLEASPSEAASNALGAKLLVLLADSKRLPAIKTMEKKLTRSTWEAVFFPAGTAAACSNFKQMPGSKAYACLCSGKPVASVVYCGALMNAEMRAAVAKIQAALNQPRSDSSGRRLSMMDGLGEGLREAVMQAAAPVISRFQHMHEGWREGAGVEDEVRDGQSPEEAATAWNVPEGTFDGHGNGNSGSSSNSSWNSTAVYRGMPNRALLAGPGLTDEVLESAGQFLDMAEKMNTVTRFFPGCSKQWKSRGGAPKDFRTTAVGKPFKKVSAMTAEDKKEVAKKLIEDEFCCEAEACVPVAQVVDLCLSGKACVPNAIAAMYKGGIAVCTESECTAVDEWKGAVMDSLIAVKLAIELKVCLLETILEKARKFVPFFPELCIKLATLTYYPLKGILEVGTSLEINFWLVGLSASLTGVFKVHDVPAICASPYYKCDDFCTMKVPSEYGKFNIKVTSVFGDKDLYSTELGSYPKCDSDPGQVESNKLANFVMYTVDWAQYRNISDPPKFTRPDWCRGYAYTPKDLDGSLFTHVNYAFAKIEPGTFQVTNVEHNDDALIAELVAVRNNNRGLKLLISIGGWSFSRGDQVFQGSGSEAIFPAMASTASNRAAFIASAIAYARAHQFDGIDLDWEYPCYAATASCRAEVTNFSALAAQMRAATSAAGLLLTAAMMATPTPAAHYELDKLHPHFDMINLMTYDFHGGSFETSPADVQTPIRSCHANANNKVPAFDIATAVDAYLGAGVPPEKINLGLGLYGRTFKLTSSDDQPGLAPANGAPAAGACTLNQGSLAWYEIKRLVRKEDIKEDPTMMAAWARYGTDGWVGFDTPNTHRQKMCWARFKKLGGVMAWDAESDDGMELSREIKKQMDTASCPDFKEPSCQ